jgi:glutathione S-transferase
MQLVIGDKLYSTWSMRPWLVLKRLGVAFEEIPVKLRQPGTSAAMAVHSPSALAPALKDGDVTVWDSLAVCEYLADKYPDAGLWPADREARAMARAAAAEMHSGFQSLRGECPMDLSHTGVATLSEATQANVRRIVRLWSDLRARYGAGGPFLVGGWSIADAYYTPVATRFRSYGVHLSDYGDLGAAGAYCETLLEQPEFLDWRAGALKEVEAA